MNHSEIKEKLFEYAEGQLLKEEQLEIAQHLN